MITEEAKDSGIEVYSQMFLQSLTQYIQQIYPLMWPHPETVKEAALPSFNAMTQATHHLLQHHDIDPTPFTYTPPRPQPWPEAHYDQVAAWHLLHHIHPPLIILHDGQPFTYDLILRPTSALVVEWKKYLYSKTKPFKQ